MGDGGARKFIGWDELVERTKRSRESSLDELVGRLGEAVDAITAAREDYDGSAGGVEDLRGPLSYIWTIHRLSRAIIFSKQQEEAFRQKAANEEPPEIGLTEGGHPCSRCLKNMKACHQHRRQ